MSPFEIIGRICVQQDDITAFPFDAIVNAASMDLLGGGGVDYAIHRAARPGLLEQCRRIPEVSPGIRCPTGEARATGGHELLVRHVIHTVGPVWSGGMNGEPELLRSCYINSLRLAVDLGVKAIAFPGISCGNFGYPLGQAAEIAIAAVTEFLATDRELKNITLMDIDTEVANAFAAEWDSFRARQSLG